MRVVAVTDRRISLRPLPEQVAAVCDAGADVVAIREKDLPEDEFEALASEVKEVCDARGTEVWVNAFVDAAKRLGIDTVWVPIARLREEGRPDARRVVVSVHSYEEAMEADRLGGDAVVYGNVYETSCKPGLPARGTEELRLIGLDSDVPVYAIGGIAAGNMQAVHDCGVDGVCVRSGLMEAEDPSVIVKAARSVLDRSEHVEVAGHPVEDLLLLGADADAGHRSRLNLGPSRVGHDAVREALPVRDGLELEELPLVLDLEDGDLLSAVVPRPEG